MPARECPHCGAPLSKRALACRECGSDARTGWAEDAETSMYGDPTTLEDREYEEFLARELGHAAPAGVRWRRRLWIWAVAAVLVAFLVWVVSSCRAQEGESRVEPDPEIAPSGPVMPYAHYLHVGEAIEPEESGAAALGSAYFEAHLPGDDSWRWRVEHVTPIVRPPIRFDEVLPSWNIHVPDGGGVAIDLKLELSGVRGVTPWLRVGQVGDPPNLPSVTECPLGRVATDYFTSHERFAGALLRFTFRQPRSGYPVVVERWALCFSDRSGETPATFDAGAEPPREGWQRRLPVPFRSQRVEDPTIAGRICSPTSVSMVLAYRGVDLPTGLVAERLYDAEHDIYGNWPHNVQGAFSLGVPGHVTRFNDWRAVRRSIAEGQPVIASISAVEGQLTGAPYEETSGHLFVICGFDGRGDVLVNDPAAPAAEAGLLTYARDELEEVWMRKGGTAYVLLDAEARH
jgi:hypothetical protein